MKYEKLIERVNGGEEFLFEYNNEEYWISQNKYGYYLTKVSNGATQEFDRVSELFKNAKIDGKTILEIWNIIKEQF